MAFWVRIATGLLLRGGIVLLAYFLLSPAIWSRGIFEGMEFGLALVAVGGWGFLPGSESISTWARYQVWMSLGSVATLVVAAVLFEALLGDESALTTVQQRIAFGTAVIIAVWFWVRLHNGTRMRPFTDPDGETRREEIRANIRREIDEIEESAGGKSDPAQPDAY